MEEVNAGSTPAHDTRFPLPVKRGLYASLAVAFQKPPYVQICQGDIDGCVGD